MRNHYYQKESAKVRAKPKSIGRRKHYHYATTSVPPDWQT